jgi:hypothetical protein
LKLRGGCVSSLEFRLQPVFVALSNLVPKLCLGTHVFETLFPLRAASDNFVKRSFAKDIPKRSLGTRKKILFSTPKALLSHSPGLPQGRAATQSYPGKAIPMISNPEGVASSM